MDRVGVCCHFAAMTELAKSFEPAAIEAKWASAWAEPGLFAPTLDATIVGTLIADCCCSIAHSLAMSGTATARHKRISQGSSQEAIFYEAHPTPNADSR